MDSGERSARSTLILTLPATVFRNENGTQNVSLPAGLLHSRRNPEQEGIRLAGQIRNRISELENGPESAAFLIVGVGFGYHIPPLLEAPPPVPLLFYEPLQALRALLDSGRYAELRRQGALLLDDLQELHRRIDLKKSRLHIYIHPQYRRFFGELESRIHDLLLPESAAVHSSTIRRFFRTWSRNFVARLVSCETMSFLTAFDFSDRANTRAVYCGAAPTLLDDLASHDYSGSYEKSGLFLIASDTALAPLLNAGITPQVVVSVDCGPGTLYHLSAAADVFRSFEKRPGFDFPVITWSAGPRHLPLFFPGILYYRSTFPFDQVLGDGPLANIPEWRNPTGNTLGIALRIAAASGLDRLILAGTTMRTSGGISHIRGTGYAAYARRFSSRVRPADSYRPGGYAARPTLKNQLALESLAAMGADLGVRIQGPEHLVPTDAASRSEHRFTYTSRHREFPTRELIDHLSGVGIGGRQSELHSYCSSRDLEKWMRILTLRH